MQNESKFVDLIHTQSTGVAKAVIRKNRRRHSLDCESLCLLHIFLSVITYLQDQIILCDKIKNKEIHRILKYKLGHTERKGENV